jgi:hypothetical protein
MNPLPSSAQRRVFSQKSLFVPSTIGGLHFETLFSLRANLGKSLDFLKN